MQEESPLPPVHWDELQEKEALGGWLEILKVAVTDLLEFIVKVQLPVPTSKIRTRSGRSS
jgi:hypothetical protein